MTNPVLGVHDDATQISHLVDSIWRTYRSSQTLNRDSLEALVQLAISDGVVGKDATTSLIRDLVEPLNDSFSPDDYAFCDALLSEAIALSLNTHMLRSLSNRLFPMTAHPSARTLLSRKAIVQRTDARRDPKFLKRVVLLSRVTVGADVVTIGTIVRALRNHSPFVEIVFIGPQKNWTLFAGAGVILKSVPYPRFGNLAAKLLAAQDVALVIEEIIAGLAQEEYLVLDAGSRLTQLGLLPVCDDSRYAFFNPHVWSSSPALPLARICGEWITTVLANGKPSAPGIWISDQMAGMARELDRMWVTSQPLAGISYGVGGNPSKQLSEQFEYNLLHNLISSGFRILLNLGVDPVEVARCQRIARAAAGDAVGYVNVSGPTICGEIPTGARIVLLDADPAGVASTATLCRLYISYDSYGQHMAAALGVPVITLFGVTSGEVHRNRWTPCGQKVKLIPFQPGKADESEILESVLESAVNQ